MLRADYVEVVGRALSEDLGRKGDITSDACIPPTKESKGVFVARAPGVIAGLEVVAYVFEALDPSVSFEPLVVDGERVEAGDRVAGIAGHSRSVLSGERTALNLLGRMSGVATATAELVEAVSGTGAKISDTRKTMPGLRALDKYAVRVGGGMNHRFGLYDAVLIKDNHLVAGGDIAGAVAAARAAVDRGVMIEVEVEDLEQLEQVLDTDADRVLLDNMAPEMLRRAVEMVGGNKTTEASGGVTLESVRRLAETGVDIISVGWITHSPPQLDIALDFTLIPAAPYFERMENQPVRVAVTGAAGQIGYSLLFRIASGDMLGFDQPVILQMLEIPTAGAALRGVAMELEDGAFPLLAGVVETDDPETAFDGAEIAMLVGAMPRTSGMERADLLSANGAIFTTQGKAIAAAADSSVKVLVVGNPANTNALIAMTNAEGMDQANFTAMTRLDHNRAVGQLAKRVGRPVTSIRRMTIWGNHSSTQYPDLFHCEVDGQPANELVDDQAWIDTEFIPTVAMRGAAIIEARGASSAASAANAAIDHIRDWWRGTPEGDWVSMGVPSDGSYGVPEGLMSSFPCICRDGRWEIVQGLEIDDYSKSRIDASVAELMAERDAVRALGLI